MRRLAPALPRRAASAPSRRRRAAAPGPGPLPRPVGEEEEGEEGGRKRGRRRRRRRRRGGGGNRGGGGSAANQPIPDAQPSSHVVDHTSLGGPPVRPRRPRYTLFSPFSFLVVV